MTGINQLWHSGILQEWLRALERYWEFVRPANLELERSMESLDLETIRQLDSKGWYDFLLNQYFPWKYTALNRRATTTKWLRQYAEEGRLDELHVIMKRLLQLNTQDILQGLRTAIEIKGLGTAGASGLLALLYPKNFGTVDQFAVKALRAVRGLSEARDVARMNPDSLSLRDAVLLISIMRRKAEENNRLFGTSDWTPRKIDKVLWTYGRDN